MLFRMIVEGREELINSLINKNEKNPSSDNWLIISVNQVI